MVILGIDPGQEGGFAVLDGDSVIVEPMPQKKDGKIDSGELFGLLSHYVPKATFVYIEKAGLRPRQSVQTTFACGFNHGILLGMLGIFNVEPLIVRPTEWSKHYSHGVTEKDKHKRYAAIKVARRRIVSDLYPGIDLKKTERSSVPHEGMVDALLIADYGWKLNRQLQLREDPIHE